MMKYFFFLILNLFYYTTAVNYDRHFSYIDYRGDYEWGDWSFDNMYCPPESYAIGYKMKVSRVINQLLNKHVNLLHETSIAFLMIQTKNANRITT